MVSEKLGPSLLGTGPTQLMAGGAAPSSAAVLQAREGLVVMTTDPVVVILGRAPPPTPSGRPNRPPGTGTSGWASGSGGATATSAAGGAAGAGGAGTPSTRTSSSASTSTASKATGPLAFLDDSKLSVDEKLFRLALYMTGKSDQELEKKLDEVSGRQKASSSKGGLLGKVTQAVDKASGGALSGVLGPGVDLLQSAGMLKVARAVSGPVLAAGAVAMGMPELASAARALGPVLVDAAVEVAGTPNGGKTSSSGAKTDLSQADGDGEVSRKDLIELEYLQQKQQQTFGLLSNLMKGMHDTRMSVIGNLRA